MQIYVLLIKLKQQTKGIKMQENYKKLLNLSKQEKDDEESRLAIVAGISPRSMKSTDGGIFAYRIVTLHDSELKKDVKVTESLFGSEIMDSCLVGDLVTYTPQTKIPDGDGYWAARILRNISNEQRMKAFQNAYNAVYGKSK